jgi:chromate transport protein ChrA
VFNRQFQELFALCQALPGPGSTKLLFCITLIHAGIVPAAFVLLLWSLPGAIGMYGLSLGIQRVNDVLPAAVYALLSGLNSSTVGIIALAAIQLAEKAIQDRLTRLLVIFGACAGLCYNALWYFPVLMVIGGSTTVLWDSFLRQQVGKLQAIRSRRKRDLANAAETANTETNDLPLQATNVERASITNIRTSSGPQRRLNSTSTSIPLNHGAIGAEVRPEHEDENQSIVAADTITHAIPMTTGLSIIAVFFGNYISL